MDPSTTLSVSVILAVLAAAVTHATWNAIAHGIKDQTLAFALIGVGGAAVSVPLVIVGLGVVRSMHGRGSPARWSPACMRPLSPTWRRPRGVASRRHRARCVRHSTP